MPITNEVLDQILKDYEKPEDLLSENGLLQQLTKALVERALNGELTHHLVYTSMKTGTMSSEKQAHLYSTLIYKAGLEKKDSLFLSAFFWHSDTNSHQHFLECLNSFIYPGMRTNPG